MAYNPTQATTENKRSKLNKLAIAASSIGCLIGLAIYIQWFSGTYQGHAYNPIYQQMLFWQIARTSAVWGLSIVFLIVTGAMTTSLKPKTIGLLMTILVWIYVSFALAYATPFTAVLCISEVSPTHCYRYNLNYKLAIMLITLSFPALLGISLSKRFRAV